MEIVIECNSCLGIENAGPENLKNNNGITTCMSCHMTVPSLGFHKSISKEKGNIFRIRVPGDQI